MRHPVTSYNSGYVTTCSIVVNTPIIRAWSGYRGRFFPCWGVMPTPIHQFTRASTNPSRIVTMRESLIRGLARVECVALLEPGAGFHIPKARAS